MSGHEKRSVPLRAILIVAAVLIADVVLGIAVLS